MGCLTWWAGSKGVCLLTREQKRPENKTQAQGVCLSRRTQTPGIYLTFLASQAWYVSFLGWTSVFPPEKCSLFFSHTRFHECPQIAHDGWKNLSLLGRGAKLEFTLTDNKVFSPQLFRSCDVKDRERGTPGWSWGLEVAQRRQSGRNGHAGCLEK